MNIYATNLDPVASALWIDDDFVKKALNEVVRAMSTVVRVIGKNIPDGIYGRLHPDSPICQWLLSNRACFGWALAYAFELLRRDRYSKETARLTALRNWYNENYFRLPRVEDFHLTNQARDKKLGVNFLDQKDTTAAYRSLMLARWKASGKQPAWNTGFQPNWYK